MKSVAPFLIRSVCSCLLTFSTKPLNLLTLVAQNIPCHHVCPGSGGGMCLLFLGLSTQAFLLSLITPMRGTCACINLVCIQLWALRCCRRYTEQQHLMYTVCAPWSVVSWMGVSFLSTVLLNRQGHHHQSVPQSGFLQHPHTSPSSYPTESARAHACAHSPGWLASVTVC